jgi:DNA replication protein
MNPTPSFKGFPDGKTRLTRIPAQFFSELLPQIDHLGELKVTLYAFWFLDQMEGSVRYVRAEDFMADEGLNKALEPDPANMLVEALARAVKRGTLLKAQIPGETGPEDYYFLNSPRGRAALQAALHGDWRPTGDASHPISLDLERPNIYRLYEENIGPLTPMISEELKEAEGTYPMAWIEDAIRIAVGSNVRRWKYVQAILRKRQEEGRDAKARPDSEKDRRRYTEGPYADIIEH